MARFRRMGASSNLGVAYGRSRGWRPVPYKPRRPTIKKLGAPLRTGRRVRARMGASYTVTKTKQKRKLPRVSKTGDNHSLSVNTIGKKWQTRFEKMLYRKVVSPQTVFLNASGNVSSTTGRQQATFFVMLPKATLTTMETAANGGATNVPVKMFLRSGKAVYRFRNTVNTTCNMTLYDIVTKKAPPDTTLDAPTEAWTKGLTDYGFATGINTVGQTPFRSPEFNQYFGVNRVTKVLLEPGQQHDHTVYHNYNRVVDSIRFQNSVSTAIPGITRYLMVVFHGTLGHEALAPTTVSYVPITLDYASSLEYTYGWLEKTAKSFSLTENVTNTITTFNFMGEQGDIDANVVAS